MFNRYAATAITECVRQELMFLNEYIKITVSVAFVLFFFGEINRYVYSDCHKNKPFRLSLIR